MSVNRPLKSWIHYLVLVSLLLTTFPLGSISQVSAASALVSDAGGPFLPIVLKDYVDENLVFGTLQADSVRTQTSFTLPSSQEDVMLVSEDFPIDEDSLPFEVQDVIERSRSSIQTSERAAVFNATIMHPTPELQQNPQIAYNPDDDEYMVTWDDRRLGSSVPHIYAQRVSGEGVLLGKNITITQATNRQSHPRIEYASGSQVYLIAWMHFPATANEYDLYGQIVSRSGALVGNSFVMANTTVWEGPDDIIYNSKDDRFLVLWRTSCTGFWCVKARHVDLDGTMGPVLQVTQDSSHHEVLASGAYNADDDQYLVAWKRDLVSSSSTVWYGNIYGRRISGDGTVTTTDTIPIATSGSLVLRHYVDVVYVPALKRYVALWNDSRAGNYDIYGQLVAPDGTLDGSNYAISSASEDEIWPKAVLDAESGELMVVWARDNGGTAADDIYARRLGTDGQPLNAAFSVMPRDAAQSFPTIAGDDAGKFFVTWQDEINGDWDIFGALYQPPVADFVATPVSGYLPLSVTLSNNSLYASAYVWDFGDGHTSVLTNPTHVYTQCGVFPVVLTAVNSIGQMSVTTFITVEDVPIDTLLASNSSPTIIGAFTTLTATVAAGSNVTYTWDLGDGQNAVGAIVTHTYLTMGLFTATVTATNSSNFATMTTPAIIIPSDYIYLPLIMVYDSTL